MNRNQGKILWVLSMEISAIILITLAQEIYKIATVNFIKVECNIIDLILE